MVSFSGLHFHFQEWWIIILGMQGLAFRNAGIVIFRNAGSFSRMYCHFQEM
jgi:hypothetical protein